MFFRSCPFAIAFSVAFWATVLFVGLWHGPWIAFHVALIIICAGILVALIYLAALRAFTRY